MGDHRGGSTGSGATATMLATHEHDLLLALADAILAVLDASLNPDVVKEASVEVNDFDA